MTRDASLPTADAPATERDLADDLARLLVRALRLLRDAGGADPACVVAADAWQAAHRRGHPAAQRFNGLLHYLTQPAPEQGEGMSDDKVLDVRQEIPARRHELIFDTYGALTSGDAFVLVNDHDPKPLYYQFAAEHPNQFEWQYLEEGPQVWRVRIGRPATA